MSSSDNTRFPVHTLQCACGDDQFATVPTFFAEKAQNGWLGSSRPSTLPTQMGQSQPSTGRQGRVVQEAAQEGSTSQSRGTMASNPPQNGKDPIFPARAGLDQQPHGGSVYTNPLKDLSYHVFLGVPVGDDVRLEHIRIVNYNEYISFKSIRKGYTNIKDLIRFHLGIRKFACCDFFKFEKFDAEEFVALERDRVQAPQYKYYQYNPKPVQNMAPISRHEFKKRFYWYYGRCLLGALGLRNSLHRCKKRCRTCPDAVNLVPKRLSPLEIGGDAREEFWGLYVGEVISAITVVVYLILILIAPFLFWFLWLFCWGHPGDLQNASVPLICTLSLVSVSSCGLFGGSLYKERAI